MQNYQKYFKSIDGLTLYTAASCNLNCSYCYLHSFEIYKEINQDFIKKWTSGEYEETIKKIFSKLGIQNDQITNLDIWGGDTFLNLKEIKKSLIHLISFFPSLSYFLASSNWLCDMSELVDFLDLLNMTVKKPVSLNLQASIDGPDYPYNEQGHSGNWKSYLSQYKKFAELVLPKIDNWKNIANIRLLTKPTINVELFLTSFNNEESIIEYLDYLTYYNNLIQKEILKENPKIKFDMGVPTTTMPIQASVQEGIDYHLALQKWELLLRKYYLNNNFHLTNTLGSSKNLSYLDNI